MGLDRSRACADMFSYVFPFSRVHYSSDSFLQPQVTLRARRITHFGLVCTILYNIYDTKERILVPKRSLHPFSRECFRTCFQRETAWLCRAPLRCEFSYKCRACGAVWRERREKKKSLSQPAERTLPWINRGLKCVRKVVRISGDSQVSVYIIFSVFSEGRG